MKTNFLRGLLSAGALLAFTSLASAQLIAFRATISGAQETPANSQPGTGTAVMLYDVSSNTFDIAITLNNFSNTITASHIHEGAVGVAGPVVTNFGSEAVYTRSGTTLTATFHNVTHGGTKLTLLQNGAYVNFHSAAFPGGEIRGQLIAQPKRLVASMNVAQEQAAFPTVALTGNANAYGAAVMTYDPGTNKINLHINLYNWVNTLTLSHYHEGAPGLSGAVVQNLGAGTIANYVITGTNVTGTFLNLTYGGDPVKLLTGGAYLNFHSNIFSGGECRGQVIASDEVLSSRIGVLSTRGFVGTGAQVLIAGINIPGPEPMRLLITAKGPSLAVFGVSGVLADPTLTLYDSAGQPVASNDNYATGPSAGDITALGGAPGNSAESALLLILPPGNYTALVSGANGTTGIALLEAVDIRSSFTLGAGLALASPARVNFAANQAVRPSPLKSQRPAPEFCIAPITTVATVALRR